MLMSNDNLIDLELYSVTSSDLPEEFMIMDLNNEYGYESSNASSVMFQITLDIGPKGENYSNLFGATVVTKNNVKYFYNKKIIEMEEYTYSKFRMKIFQIIYSCRRENWILSAIDLSKHFNWEYEGMAPPGFSS